MATLDAGVHDHVQKSRNFPAHLLKAIQKGEDIDCPDLHGYCCETARRLMHEAFCHELPWGAPPAYVFIIGCGRHSTEKYRVQVQKACAEGLREAGLKEDRHASAGVVGQFKQVEDKYHGMHLVKVFPRRCMESGSAGGMAACNGGAATGEGADTDGMAQRVVEMALSGADPDRLHTLSVLGLAELLTDLLKLAQEAKACGEMLRSGGVPVPLQISAHSMRAELQTAMKGAFAHLQEGLKSPSGISGEERHACQEFVEQLAATETRVRDEQPSKKLCNLLDQSPERRGDAHPYQSQCRRELSKAKVELKEVEQVCERWEKGKHRFSSIDEQTRTLKRRADLWDRVAEIEDNLWHAARVCQPAD